MAGAPITFVVLWVSPLQFFYDARDDNAGNIWIVQDDITRPGAVFSNNFLKQMAVGTGFGLRMDFTYFRIRLDFGYKLRNPYPIEGKFDLIFCRNVLIYFERAGKANVARRLLAKLCPHGYLFLGHAETLAGISDEVQTAGPSVYRLKQRAV